MVPTSYTAWFIDGFSWVKVYVYDGTDLDMSSDCKKFSVNPNLDDMVSY